MFSCLPLLQKKQKPQTFPLLNLPFLAMEEVIKLIDSLEKMKLCTISKKMSNTVKLTNPKIEKLQVEFGELVSKIGLSDEETFEIPGKTEKKWFKKTAISSVPNALLSLGRIQNAFPETGFTLTLRASKMSTTNARDVVAISQSDYCKSVTVVGGILRKEQLDVLMEFKDRESGEVILEATRFPKDYWHENAFKCSNSTTTIKYNDARWLTPERIIPMRVPLITLQLGHNKYSSKDFNTLFKFWSTSESDMFQELNFYMKPDTINFEDMFDGLTVLLIPATYKPCKHYGFIRAENIENRVHHYLTVIFREVSITITSHAVLHRVIPDDPNAEGEVLDTLHTKRALELQLENGELDDSRRLEISMEIQQLDAQLIEDGVTFENGKARRAQSSRRFAWFYVWRQMKTWTPERRREFWDRVAEQAEQNDQENNPNPL